MKIKFFILSLMLINLSSLWAQKITNEQYITIYKLIAIQEMFDYKIPASITLAQGILESGSGNSRLATKANNHFGIKCHSDWKGKKVYHDDDEKNECFRKYPQVEDSYRDHSLFLSKKKRYADLFDLKLTNYKGWAKGLKKAGYATSTKYPTLLINLVEKYDLNQYDQISEKDFHKMVEVANADPRNQSIIPEQYQSKIKPIPTPTPSPVVSQKPIAKGSYHEVLYHNRVKYIVIRQGDTPEKISNEFDIWLKQIYKFNDLEEESKLRKGMVIYLQPKRRKGDVKYHVVDGSETLRDISQRHGIKLSWLIKRNHLHPNSKLRKGQKLWLRKTKPPSKASY